MIKKLFQILLVQAMIVFGFMAFSGSQAQAQNYYGSIAYSPSSKAVGWSYDYRSRRRARREALRSCRRHGGGCRNVVTFRNACGALARGRGGWGSGWGVNRRVAERFARRSCRKHASRCRVIRWVCTKR